MKTLLHICLFNVLLCGCAAIGPGTVTRDRFDYTAAISDSWKQQMLFNMVKIRYADAPVFIEVASVINQYSIEGGADLRLSWAFPVMSGGTNTQSIGGGVRYVDRPTITYTPISGERFTRSLMTPISPTAVLSLIQAGYPADQVLRISVHSVNGIRNRFGSSTRARSADPQFYPLLERLRRIQDSGGIGFRVEKKSDREGALVTIRGKVGEETEEDSRWVRKTLGLNPVGQNFTVAYGSIARNDRELAILSRSVLEILVDLASFIEVPREHVDERIVNPTMAEEAPAGVTVPPPLLRILSSRTRPTDAYVAVPYQDCWFYIDNRDYPSKRLFSFIMFIFALTETGGKEGAPIVTIPAG